jgi:hypothetical protein
MEQIGRTKQPRPLEALKLIGRSCEHRSLRGIKTESNQEGNRS